MAAERHAPRRVDFSCPFVFGGTFNPPHRGHLHIMHTVLNAYGKCRILAVPAFLTPFKESDRSMLPFEVRARLLELAVGDYAGIYSGDEAMRIEVSRVEGMFGRKVYTSELVAWLKDEMAFGGRVPFVAGDDVLKSLGKWHDAEYLKANVLFVIVPREPDDGLLERRIAEGFAIERISADALRASSTEVKENGRSDLLTPGVLAELERLGIRY